MPGRQRPQPLAISTDICHESAVAGAATIGRTEAAHPDSRAYGTALGSQCCGCRRPHPVGSRTTRQNDGRRHHEGSAERHIRLGCVERYGACDDCCWVDDRDCPGFSEVGRSLGGCLFPIFATSSEFRMMHRLQRGGWHGTWVR
jgi:hypothetical protein